MCLHLHALCIPAESCGWGHLASLTAGSCFCIHMGIQGKFPASTSCAALCSFIVPTTQRMQFYHIRKILSRATDIRSSRRPSMFFFLTELPQEAPLHPSEGSQHSIREKETEWGFRCIQDSARTKCDHREKKKCRLVKPKVIQPVLFSRRLWMCSFCLSAYWRNISGSARDIKYIRSHVY